MRPESRAVPAAVAVGAFSCAVLLWSVAVRRVSVPSPAGTGELTRTVVDPGWILASTLMAALAIVAVAFAVAANPKRAE